MRELLILRHAKSSWNHPGLDDHDRPLNKRGERDAPRMGRLLAELGRVPDAIVTSTAVRARTTAGIVAEACGFEGRMHETAELYLASPETVVEVLGRLGDDCRRAMVVAHNPGLEELVEGLTGRDERLPTAALAAVELPIDGWDELAPGILGKLAGTWRPKEL